MSLKWQLDSTGTSLVLGTHWGTAGGAAGRGLRSRHRCICHHWVRFVRRGDPPQAAQAEFVKEAAEPREKGEEAPSIVARHAARTSSGVPFSLPPSVFLLPLSFSLSPSLRSPHEYVIWTSSLLHPQPPPPSRCPEFPMHR